MKREWIAVHSIRMSGTELFHRRPVQCNHNAVCHDARLIDCFYQGYNTLPLFHIGYYVKCQNSFITIFK